jgi:hypothetical protein
MTANSNPSVGGLQEHSGELTRRMEKRFLAEVARSFDEFHKSGLAIRNSGARQPSTPPILRFRDRSSYRLTRPTDVVLDRYTVEVSHRPPYDSGYPIDAQFSPRIDTALATRNTPRPSEYYSFSQAFPRDGVFDLFAQTWKDDPDILDGDFYMPLDPEWDPDLEDDYHHRFVTIPEVHLDNDVMSKSTAAGLQLAYIPNTSLNTNDRAVARVVADIDVSCVFWFFARSPLESWDFARACLEVRLVVWHGSNLYRNYLRVERRSDAVNPQSFFEPVTLHKRLIAPPDGYTSPFYGNVSIAVHGQLMVQVARGSALTVGCSASSLSSEWQGTHRIIVPEVKYQYSRPGQLE